MDKEKKLNLTKDEGDGAKVSINLEKNRKAVESYLGVNTEANRRPAYISFATIFAVLFGMFSNVFAIIGLVLAVITLILIMRKSYWIAYRWNRSIVMYLKDDKRESLKYLEKLPKEEKEKEAYKKMKKLLEN